MANRPLTLVQQLSLFARFARALPAYLGDRLDEEGAHALVRADLASRGARLLRVVTDGILAIRDGPYARLFRHAGVDARSVAELTEREGVEGALERLYRAGVYVTLDEFKGRQPIVRGSLRFDVSSRDFDNPLGTVHYAVESGGSRSAGTRITIDLAHNTRSSIYDFLLFQSQGLLDRPYVVYQPTLPYGAGVNALLRYARFGRMPPRWFSQNKPPTLGKAWQHGMVTRYLVWETRRYGSAVPKPEYAPLHACEKVAEHLAILKARGNPALVNSNASSGTRVCRAARRAGLDIAGTVFRLGGEPLTPARVRVVGATGSRAVSIYGMGECGRIGLPCSAASEVDDVHVLTDKLAVIRGPASSDRSGSSVPINVYTTLDASSPKLMFNVESDDYAVHQQRNCGCPLGDLGFGLHMHTIRSHEKLTSEGMNFLGHDLIRLVEEVLPRTFGGGPTDYQFVEDEDETSGLPKVRLLVSPRVQDLDPPRVADAVINFLNNVDGAGGAFGERWREGQTLTVERREPFTTRSSKILALHTMKPKEESADRGFPPGY